MSLEALNKWRLIIPGIFLLLLVLFAIQDSFSELTKTFTNFQLKYTIYIIVFIAAGVLYYILNIRDLLWKPYLDRVQNNIKDTLLRPFKKQLDKQQEDYLRDGLKLMIIFWHFIDNDNSLLEKAKRVRFNGLIWTSTIDLTIIAACGSLLFWVKLVIVRNSYNLWMAIIFLVLALVSFVFIQLTTKRHISLSDEQLETICQSYRPQLEGKVHELLQN